MNIEQIIENSVKIAVISSNEVCISTPQSALDLIMTVKYDSGVDRIVLPKKTICEDFFILSTGVAGEILQKCINYQVKMAIYGDYSRYTSKPLKDFIYESNQGNDFYFVATKEEAVARLVSAA